MLTDFAIGRLENFKRPAEGSTERWVLGTAWRMTPKRVLKGTDVDQPRNLAKSVTVE